MANYSNVFVCKNNIFLTNYTLKIPDYHDYIFYGRKIIKEKYIKEFSPINGHYFSFPEYVEDDVINFNLKLEVDNNGFVTNITSYKLRDYTYGCFGRGQTKNVPYRKKDYEAIYSLLSDVLENPGKPLFDEIYSKLESGCKLTNGFIFKRRTETTLEFKNKKGKNVSLNIPKLIDNLSLVYKYVEILYSEEFLKENHYYFETQKVPLYSAVFSLISYKNIPNYKILLKEAKFRAKLNEALNDYDNLLIACKENNLEKARQYINSANLVVSDNMEADFPLLCAVKNNNYELAKLLLEHGAFSIQIAHQVSPDKPYKDFSESLNRGALSALYIATINHNRPLMKLIISYHGNKAVRKSDYYLRRQEEGFRIDELIEYLIKKDEMDSLKMILENLEDSEHIYPIKFRDDANLCIEDLKYFAEQTTHRVEWSSKQIAKAFRENRRVYSLMLKQCYCKYKQKIIVSIDEAVKLGDIELLRDLSKYEIKHINNFSEIYINAINNGKNFITDFTDCICKNYSHYDEMFIRQFLKTLGNSGDIDNSLKMVASIPWDLHKELRNLCYERYSHSAEEFDLVIEKLLPVLYANKEIYIKNNKFYFPLDYQIIKLGSCRLWFKIVNLYPDNYNYNNKNSCLNLLDQIRESRLVKDDLFDKTVDKMLSLLETKSEKNNFLWDELNNYIKFFNEPEPYSRIPKKKKSEIYQTNLYRFSSLIGNFKIVELLKEKLTRLDESIWENKYLYNKLRKSYPDKIELIRLIKPRE